MAQPTKERGGRFYHHRNPKSGVLEKYWAVTTIIDLTVPKPALVNWAANTTAEKALDNLDVLYMFKKKGQKQEALDYLRNERFRKTERARVTGSQLHEAIEAKKLGRPYPGVPEDVRDYYEAFLQMLDDQQPIIEATEANVFHRSRRYSGTLDVIAIWPKLTMVPKHCPECECQATWVSGHITAPVFDAAHHDTCETKPELEAFEWYDPRGPRMLGDYKTGKGPRKGGVYSETGLQLSAYKNAEFIEGPEKSEHPMPKVDGCIALHLQPGWCEIIAINTSPVVFSAFLYWFESVKWVDEISKHVVTYDPLAMYEVHIPTPDTPTEYAPLPDRPPSSHFVGISRAAPDPVKHAVSATAVWEGAGKALLAECLTKITALKLEAGFSPVGRRTCEKCAAKVTELGATFPGGDEDTDVGDAPTLEEPQPEPVAPSAETETKDATEEAPDPDEPHPDDETALQGDDPKEDK